MVRGSCYADLSPLVTGFQRGMAVPPASRIKPSGRHCGEQGKLEGPEGDVKKLHQLNPLSKKLQPSLIHTPQFISIFLSLYIQKHTPNSSLLLESSEDLPSNPILSYLFFHCRRKIKMFGLKRHPKEMQGHNLKWGQIRKAGVLGVKSEAGSPCHPNKASSSTVASPTEEHPPTPPRSRSLSRHSPLCQGYVHGFLQVFL